MDVRFAMHRSLPFQMGVRRFNCTFFDCAFFLCSLHAFVCEFDTSESKSSSCVYCGRIISISHFTASGTLKLFKRVHLRRPTVIHPAPMCIVRRTNVAITRARRGLVVIGHRQTLAHESLSWAPWLRWAGVRGIMQGIFAYCDAARDIVHRVYLPSVSLCRYFCLSLLPGYRQRNVLLEWCQKCACVL